MFELDYSIKGIITKKWALVSLDLDKRVKSYRCLKIRDKYVNKIITDGSLAGKKEKKKKKKNLLNERSLQRLT